MARLRNRIVKADFWTDAELLRWHRDKRETYRGLWAIAEDSGCLEDDPFGWKLVLWPSPLDADLTLERLAEWRDELVESDKLIPYEADGKRYFFIKTFHQHEHPRNPQSPDLPLPPWVTYQSRQVERKDSGRGGTYTINEYVINTALIPSKSNRMVTVPLAYGNGKETPVQSSPVQSCSVLNPPGEASASAPEEDTAQTIVAFAVDRARETGVALTKAVTGQLASEVGRQFKAGANPMLIRKAVAVLVDENKSPSTLSYVMRDLSGGGSRGRLAAVSGRSADGEW